MTDVFRDIPQSIQSNAICNTKYLFFYVIYNIWNLTNDVLLYLKSYKY